MNAIVTAIAAYKAHKGRALTSFFAIASMSLAHYAGFVMELPLQIISAAGSTLVPGVTTTFLFYVALCAVLARVTIGFLQVPMLAQFILFDRIEHGKTLHNTKKKRKYVRSYNKLLRNEGYIWLGLQATSFVILLCILYIDLSITWKPAIGIFIAISLVALSGAFRSKLLLILSWEIFIKRVKNRSAFRLNVGSASFITLASALVVTSFALGAMRMTNLKNATPQQISNHYYSGYANLLASSGNTTLAYEKKDGNVRYIFTTPDYAVGVESKQKSFTPLTITK